MESWDFITRRNLIFSGSGWRISRHHRERKLLSLIWGQVRFCVKGSSAKNQFENHRVGQIPHLTDEEAGCIAT